MVDKFKNLFKKPVFLLFVILVLAFLLRLINLGAEPYWGDEVLSLDIVHHYQDNVSAMVKYVAAIEIHPPLYYLMLYWWAKWFGYGEAAIRSLSLIFSLGVILLVYWLAKKLFNSSRAGLLAAFLSAVLPMSIEFSQEARPYIIFVFFGLLAALVYWHYRESNKKIFLVIYIFANLIGLYLHYSYLFFATALALFWLMENFWQKEKGSRFQPFIVWLIVHSLIFLGYYHQLIVFFYKFLLSKYIFFGLENTSNYLGKISFFEFTINQLVWLNEDILVTKFEIFIIFLFKLVCLAVFIWLLIKSADKIKGVLTEYGRPLFFITWLAIVPIILFLFSPQGVPYTIILQRHIITSVFFIAILLAYFFSQLKIKLRLFLLALFLISLINSVALIIGNDGTWDYVHRYKIFADHINVSYQPGDMILLRSVFSRSDFNHFLRQDAFALAVYPLILTDFSHDVLSSRETLGLIENEYQFRIDNKEHTDRLRIGAKMDYLMGKYHSQRVWLVGLDQDAFLDEWFQENNWREAMISLGPLFPVQLYVKPR